MVFHSQIAFTYKLKRLNKTTEIKQNSDLLEQLKQMNKLIFLISSSSGVFTFAHMQIQHKIGFSYGGQRDRY